MLTALAKAAFSYLAAHFPSAGLISRGWVRPSPVSPRNRKRLKTPFPIMYLSSSSGVDFRDYKIRFPRAVKELLLYVAE